MKQRICGAALSIALCLAMLPATAFAITVSPRPDPGTTQGQPFEHNPNTADSDSFRIPVRYIGVGEGIDQLRMFDRTEFVNALFGHEEN